MTRPSIALQANREQILQLARAHGARNVRVFGSASRGTDREGSDLDLLVDVDEHATLFTLTGLEQDLRELLGVAVDVRTPAEISRYIRDRVLAEARPL
ncbi:MAG: nucleotidyltransferase family protein [Nitrospiraceae bacterium]